jgi:hypothetical protein
VEEKFEGRWEDYVAVYDLPYKFKFSKGKMAKIMDEFNQGLHPELNEIMKIPSEHRYRIHQWKFLDWFYEYELKALNEQFERMRSEASK